MKTVTEQQIGNGSIDVFDIHGIALFRVMRQTEVSALRSAV